MPAQVVVVLDDLDFANQTVKKLAARKYEAIALPSPLVALDALEGVLSALAPASIVGRMKVEIVQAACNTLRTVAVRRRKWNLR
jgi:hypothetical protein